LQTEDGRKRDRREEKARHKEQQKEMMRDVIKETKTGRLHSFYLFTVYLTLLVTPTSPISVAARSKVWVVGRSLAGIVGSNSAGGMDVCLLCELCVVR
jgi:hypothetical protein